MANITKKQIRQLVLEELELLNEITYASAVNNLGSKKMQKAVAQWIEREGHSGITGEKAERLIKRRIRDIKAWLLNIIPDDITDNQKGLAVTWLARLTRDLKTGYMSTFIDGGFPGIEDSWSVLETFFHYQQFMSEKDLNKIKDLKELSNIVASARPQIDAHRDKKTYNDATEGTEVFRDDDEWRIAAIHNKGAACELGKGTYWCTAAPGLDYFKEYYEPNDPLFYFLDKKTGEKFQIHFGSDQWMDKNDINVDNTQAVKLINLLVNTSAAEKYRVVRLEHSKRKIYDNETTTEELIELFLALPEEEIRLRGDILNNHNADSSVQELALKTAIETELQPGQLNRLGLVERLAARWELDSKYLTKLYDALRAYDPYQSSTSSDYVQKLFLKTILTNPGVSQDLLESVLKSSNKIDKALLSELTTVRRTDGLGNYVAYVYTIGDFVKMKNQMMSKADYIITEYSVYSALVEAYPKEGLAAAKAWDKELAARQESKTYARWQKLIR